MDKPEDQKTQILISDSTEIILNTSTDAPEKNLDDDNKEINMAEKANYGDLTGIEELLMSEVIMADAVINLLVRKGIITEGELLAEIRRIKGDRSWEK